MAKYAAEIANLFISISQQQIESVAETLSLDQIRILRAEVLPKIKDSDRRKEIKEILTTRENKIDVSAERSPAISGSIQQNITVSEQLKVMLDGITTKIVSSLADEEARKLFLERATDDELFILERKLLAKSLDEQGEVLQRALEDEKTRRSTQERPDDSKDTYKKGWRKQHLHSQLELSLQWESRLWQNITKGINHVNLEIRSRAPVETHVLEPIEVPNPWYSRAWTAVKNFFSFIGSSVASLFSKKASAGNTTPYEVKLSEKEEEEVDKLRIKGAFRIADVTGIKKGDAEENRSKELVKQSMRARFGMVLAGQMVSGTKNKHHRGLFSVVDSLATPDDSDNTIKRVHDAVRSVTSVEPAGYVLNSEHIFGTGGHSAIITAREADLFA